MKKIKDEIQASAATAANVMDPHPTVVKRTDLIGEGVELIMKNRYRHLPVVDEDGCYLGMFGVNCLLRLVLPQVAVMDRGLKNVSFIYETLSDMYERLEENKYKTVETCMRTDIDIVYPDTPLIKTLKYLYDTKCSIPVIHPETRKLLGMISYFDVGQHVLDARAG